MKPHIKQFNFYRSYSLPIKEINSYADTNNLRVIAMTVLAGGSVIQQSVLVSFEPWEYNPPIPEESL